MSLPSDRIVRNWRARADEMRAISLMMKHDETRATMERLAVSYDEMADKMESRLKPAGQPSEDFANSRLNN